MKDRGRRTWGWALGLSVVLALLVGVASAKKPPKPPPDPPPPVDTGLIYYQGSKTFTMEPDGSDKQEATNPAGKSQATHDGSWWRLEYVWDDVDDEDEFWVIEVGGNGQNDFQLNFDADVYPSKSFNSMWAVHGGVADGKVSFLALRGTKGQEPSEHGLQVIYIDWANKTSTPAESLIPVGPYVHVSEEGYYWISVRYDWSPDGTSLAYINGWGTDGLSRVDCDFATETWSTEELLDAGGEDPRWSPDGTLIAFTTYSGYTHSVFGPLSNIETIEPDGTDRTMLVEGTRKLTAFNHEWSPSGSHLVYNHRTFRSLTSTDNKMDIYRITKDGGDATNLTGDLSWHPIVVAWRDE